MGVEQVEGKYKRWDERRTRKPFKENKWHWIGAYGDQTLIPLAGSANPRKFLKEAPYSEGPDRAVPTFRLSMLDTSHLGSNSERIEPVMRPNGMRKSRRFSGYTIIRIPLVRMDLWNLVHVGNNNLEKDSHLEVEEISGLG